MKLSFCTCPYVRKWAKRTALIGFPHEVTPLQRSDRVGLERKRRSRIRANTRAFASLWKASYLASCTL